MSPRSVQPIAPVEYEALLNHCSTCWSCRTFPERKCPRASALGREWRHSARQIIRARQPW